MCARASVSSSNTFKAAPAGSTATALDEKFGLARSHVPEVPTVFKTTIIIGDPVSGGVVGGTGGVVGGVVGGVTGGVGGCDGRDAYRVLKALYPLAMMPP